MPSRLVGGTRVYPRACGGTVKELLARFIGEGLSPRMRGNRSGRGGSAGRTGSIPAHAGEPWAAYPSIPCPRVYPRACGGTLGI